jgi:hypothetical protein
MPFEMSKLQYNKWEVSLLEVAMNPLLEVLHFDMDEFVIFIFGVALNQRQYEITIGNFLVCTCLDFMIMILGSVREVSAMQTHLLHVATCHVL